MYLPINAVVIALLAGVVPSIIWLVFWLREDENHPEPRFLLGSAFLGGMLAVLMAIVAEKYLAEIISDVTLRYASWASFEEIAKFLMVGLIALITKYNDEPIDAMVYCIAAALGFAALENTLFILGPLADGDMVKGLTTGNLRFIGATLVHVVSSSFVGFALGWSFYRSRFAKITSVTVGLAAAVSLHAAFNLSIINAGTSDALKVFGWIWVAVVLLIVLFEEVKFVRPKIL